jgi:hypothetical protein
MRPIIDLNNLWYSEETLIYNSRFGVVFRIIILIAIYVYGSYLFYDKQYLFSLIVFALSYFLIKIIKDLIAEWNMVQLRINSEGIQIKNEPIISWYDIENEIIIEIIKDESIDYKFAFYDAKQHKPMLFEIDKLNLSHDELINSVKIHRERFNRKNNPNKND